MNPLLSLSHSHSPTLSLKFFPSLPHCWLVVTLIGTGFRWQMKERAKEREERGVRKIFRSFKRMMSRRCFLFKLWSWFFLPLFSLLDISLFLSFSLFFFLCLQKPQTITQIFLSLSRSKFLFRQLSYWIESEESFTGSEYEWKGRRERRKKRKKKKEK